MKIVIVSDIHGNFEALSALREIYDELWVLGDLVNYGPEPAAVIEPVNSKGLNPSRRTKQPKAVHLKPSGSFESELIPIAFSIMGLSYLLGCCPLIR